MPEVNLMSWTNELYQVYELACKNPDSRPLPLSHSTANAQIELLIDEQGNFRGANTVNKDNAVTIIPVTEDSGARGSGISPMPFADKLAYIAGDYVNYVDVEPKERSKYTKYMEQLKSWCISENTHPAVSAVYAYLNKKVLIEDLVKSGVLQIEPATGKLISNVKIAGIDQEDSFVRFVVQYNDISRESRTWLDTSLYDSFINFNSNLVSNKQLCYATGKLLPVTYKHPSKIRNSGDKAKLISSNDETGFTYRGRFKDKEEAFSVSYDFSQKMHNALKWLIDTQGHSFGSLMLVTWASALKNLPDEINKPIENEWDEEEAYDSLPGYKSWLKKYIMSFRQDFTNNTKVMIMGLDAATTGRLSIALYDELQGSDFLDNLEKWHANSAWLRFIKDKTTVCSFSLYDIIHAVYGTEQKGKLECDDKLKREQILRLLPCIMNGIDLPYDLVQTIYYKASNPLAYEHYNHCKVIEVACGMYRAWKKGDISMVYDPNETNRSYLYGCLLAVADKAESDTYDNEDKNKRVTNARRYWTNFAQHPYQTWQNIEERLRPYLDRHEYRASVEKQIQAITDKFTPAAFADNRRLDPMYLLGYHHYTAHMYKKNKEDKNDGNVTTQN